MHPVKIFEPFNALSLESAETTGRIANFFTADLVPYGISDSGRDDPQQIIAFGARGNTRAANTTEPRQGFQQFWQILRIILQVRIHRDDVTTLCGLEPRP